MEVNPACDMIKLPVQISHPLIVAQEMKNKNKGDKSISIILTDILILEMMVPGRRTVKNRAHEEYSWQCLQCKHLVRCHYHTSLEFYLKKTSLGNQP